MKSNFFFGHNILAEGVLVTQLCGNGGNLSLKNCMGCDEPPFHERNVLTCEINLLSLNPETCRPA